MKNKFLEFKKIISLFIFLFACSSSISATPIDLLFEKDFNIQQEIEIKGTVKQQNSNIPIVGANILVNNKVLAKTDQFGQFTIRATPNSVITIRMLGYQPMTVQASKEHMIIEMIPIESEIDEVVVTALGIKREEKALGYSTTTVKGEDLTEALSNNWMDALSGKVAGLNLVRSNAGPVGSTKIILRGETNLTGNNEALIVVDGVVINTGSGRRSSNSSDLIYGTGSDNMPADYGSGMDDINTEDIESITVLKGAGAAALYGQRAADGAIIITTKSGSHKAKGLGVTFNSNVAFESVNRWPDFQYEYGQGTGGANYYSYGATVDGATTSSTSSAYGPKFDGQYFYQYDPIAQAVGAERTLWQAYDNHKDFFEVGKTFTNSLTIDGGYEKTTARFSFSNVKNTWIAPNTGYDRNSVAISVNSHVSDKLTVSAKVNYNNRWSDNLPGAGYGNQSLMYWFIFWQPSADYNWLRNYWVLGEENLKIKYPYSSFPENPFAITYEFINMNNRHTVNGNATANYQLNEKLSFQVRSSLDYSTENREQNRPYDAGSKLPEGSHRTQTIFSREYSADFLAMYKTKLSSNVDFSATVGGSTLKNEYRMESLASDGLTFPGVYNHSNSKYGTKDAQTIENMQVNSFYGLFATSYKDYLFIDGTLRADWTSTLAAPDYLDKSKGFVYPSLNASFILSEVASLPEVINFAKIRASFSMVGSGVQKPYQTQFAYISGNELIPSSLANPSLLVDPFIEPLRTRTFELGTDLKFLKNKINLDFTVYKGNTYNQHLNRVVDASSGYRTNLINIGEVENRGIEISLNTDQVKNKDGFNWSSMIAFSANENTIVELADSSIVLQLGAVASGQLVGKVGGSMGDLYGIGYQRSPDGQVIYDESTGYAKLTDEIIYLGNTIPKGKISLGNTFSYKGFKLSVLFDAQWGAVAHSLTHYKLSEQGKTTNTLPGRYNGIIGNGVVQNPDGSYRQNDVISMDIDNYYRSHYGIDNAEGNTFATDFIKFREARLDYTFNPKLLSRVGLLKTTLGVYGRNLFIWSNWPAYDPEFGTISGSDIVKGFEVAQFPSTRTFGFNLIVGF
ncbi:SusC/RagA family TonB-linked outer membrane protein [Sphingobacterium hungaricum]